MASESIFDEIFQHCSKESKNKSAWSKYLFRMVDILAAGVSVRPNPQMDSFSDKYWNAFVMHYNLLERGK